MHRFYCKPSEVTENQIRLAGDNVNHIKNVLRMKLGDSIIVCDENGTDYLCEIDQISSEQILTTIRERRKSETELPVQIKLYQGLPKKDKMELIIQKSVELGAVEIIPVLMKRCVVKLEDEKKEQKKRERWQMIAEGAAEQSRRGIIPTVSKALSFHEAVNKAAMEGRILVPYELASGMDTLKTAVLQLSTEKQISTISVFIGPEGGFEEKEIAYAVEQGAIPVSLGKRILRTETAGLTMLSILMYELECQRS